MKRKTENTRHIGSAYERMAEDFLRKAGYRILTRNYRCPAGEIDLVAGDGPVLVFCEVKYRKTESRGAPAEAVTVKKQKTLSRCALYYLTETGKWGMPCRFDVIGISGNEKKIVHIKDAFYYEE